ncbi:Rab-like_protein [Hexamita inflata]|uniref:Rab-like protein n=1 Tax=Hexamita inflata TaxID=28002 RepID=A0AA86NKK7_9EUKA|nr:Rab-like protein [Hexamita inflata]
MGICDSKSKINIQQKQTFNTRQRQGIIFIGQHRCGQTAICNRITSGNFVCKHNDELICNCVGYKNKQVDIIDVAGFKDRTSISESLQYFEQCQYAVVVFNMIQNNWQEQVDNRIKFITRIDKEIQIILVASKLDLYSGDLEDFEQCARDHGYPLIYCSAKTGQGIDELKQQCGLSSPNETRENSQQAYVEENYMQ